MKRLTEKNESPCTCCGGIGSCRTDCNYKQIYDRLAEYEDTGLTPKEIEDIVSVREIIPEAEYAIINKRVDNLIQKLNKLIAGTNEKLELQCYKDAEAKGLSTNLPCRVRSRVWLTEWWDACRMKKLSVPIERCILYFRIELNGIYAHFKDGCINVKYFGKTVFLTRGAAEKALEGMKNEA